MAGTAGAVQVPTSFLDILLQDFIDELRDDHILLALANPSRQVIRLLDRAKLVGLIGDENIHVNMQV